MTRDNVKKSTSKERWKDIPGYEGLYQASDLGRVRSVDRETVAKDGSVYRFKGRVLKAAPNVRSGYLYVGLRKDGRQKSCRVHLLVLLTFVGRCPSSHEGCHKNGVRVDNRLKNLKYATSAQNSADRIRHGTDHRGEKHPNRKLTESQVKKIRRLYRTGKFTQDCLGEMFGVSQGCISSVVNRKNWNHSNYGR